MKVFIAFVVFTIFALPAFSQTDNMQRFRALGDAIDTTITRSNDTLADFDSRDNDSENLTRYMLFLRQYRYLAGALSDSEFRLNSLLRGHAHSRAIAEEHTNFANYLKSMEALKTEYAAWLATVR